MNEVSAHESTKRPRQPPSDQESDFPWDPCGTLTGGVLLPTPAQEVCGPAVQDVAHGHEAPSVLRVARDQQLIVLPEQGLGQNKHNVPLHDPTQTDCFVQTQDRPGKSRFPFLIRTALCFLCLNLPVQSVTTSLP